MDLITPWNLIKVPGISSIAVQTPSKTTTTTTSMNTSSSLYRCSLTYHKLSFPFLAYPFGKSQNLLSSSPLSSSSCMLLHAKKRRNSESKPILKPTIVEEVAMDDEEEEDDDEELLFDDFQDDDGGGGGDDFEEEFLEEDDAEAYVGDGAGGGGIALAGTWWDKEALALAEDVCLSFDGDLNIYAFRTLSNTTIQVRIERMTNKSGSPSMEDIEAFTASYRARLDEAELAKSIPDNISLEVSSPGVKRVVRVPHELERFKDRPLYVKYRNEVSAAGSSSETDGVFKLISYDMEAKCCTWGLADVRINREKAGKGRRLSKKQREWRLDTPFGSLHLVQLYSEM